MKITIIGGGTAGWLTGLYFNKIGYSDITIIDSSRVGILGAGEATTPNFKGLLFQLGINEEEFLKTIGATIKVANDFINWSPYENKFTHEFNNPMASKKINETHSIEEKKELLKVLWELVTADSVIDAYEENLYFKIAELIKIKRSKANQIKQQSL